MSSGYPPATAPNPRSALLSNLRTGPAPARTQSGPLQVPSGQHGYPRLPPHTPQHRQRFPSSEHTLGPSFDDDDEDEEMLAKMAALSAGSYPYQGQQQQQGRGGNGGMGGGGGQQQMQMPRQQQQQQQYTYQQQQQLQAQQQAQLQQQELLRALAMQLASQNQGPRNIEELQLLQALAQQQQQREVEAQVEQLFRMQQAQQLQQQLMVQAQQAARLAAQPSNGQGRMQQPPASAGFNQQAFDQSYATAQAQAQLAQQLAQQQTPQQLASAYEQRHAAQQQIQANLRARSGGLNANALPNPASVAAGQRFGFESSAAQNALQQAREAASSPSNAFGQAGTNGRSMPRGLSPQPGAGAVGERTMSPVSANGDGSSRSLLNGDGSARLLPNGLARVASPPALSSGGLNPGAREFQQGREQSPEIEDGLQPSLGSVSSVWAAKSNASSNWRTKAAAAAPSTSPPSSTNGLSTSPPVSRFAGTFGKRDADGQSDSSSHGQPSNPDEVESPEATPRRPPPPQGNWASDDTLKPIYEGIGLGRPNSRNADGPPSSSNASYGPGSARSYSAQVPVQQPFDTVARTRSYDLGSNGNSPVRMGGGVLRQPRGPPSGADELGPRNFASRIRKQTGSTLTAVLGRRADVK